MSITLKLDTAEVVEMLDDAVRAIKGKELLEKAGSIVQESVRMNFKQGGRPTSWKKINKKYRVGKPLLDKGILSNSITSKVKGGKALVGTSVIYSTTQHYGAKKGSFGIKTAHIKTHDRTRNGNTYTVKAHTRQQSLPWGDIPARPFMMAQTEDSTKIEKMAKKLIEE